MLELALFGNRTFLGLSLTTFVSAAISLASIFLTTLHLQDTLGHSPLATGTRLLPLTVALIGTTLFTRAITTKLPPAAAVGTSTPLVTLGAGLLIVVTPTSTWLDLFPSMVLLGAGMAIGTSLRYDLTSRSTAPPRTSVATRINETSHHLGLALGITALGALYQYRVAAHIDQGPTTPTAAMDHTPVNVSNIAAEASAAALSFVAVVCIAVGAFVTLIALTYINRGDLHEPATSR